MDVPFGWKLTNLQGRVISFQIYVKSKSIERLFDKDFENQNMIIQYNLDNLLEIRLWDCNNL